MILNLKAPTMLKDRSKSVKFKQKFTVRSKFKKPRENTIASISANQQQVKGLDAEMYPMLKNILFKKPIKFFSRTKTKGNDFFLLY